MVEWHGDTPFSAQFNDVYYQHDGLNEARHVFLCGNNLPERWQDKRNFVIAELGFGTGLNFLAVWDSLQKQSNPPKLHFYSTEFFPLSKKDIVQAHQHFPEIQSLSERVLAHYPDHFENDWHWQANDHLTLTVLWGDATNKIRDIPAIADAWFLDGFTPANNPELWSETIFRNVAARSKTDTTFATFTVARAVRDNAEKAGFILEKRNGFGKKRHMLIGRYNG